MLPNWLGPCSFPTLAQHEMPTTPVSNNFTVVNGCWLKGMRFLMDKIVKEVIGFVQFLLPSARV